MKCRNHHVWFYILISLFNITGLYSQVVSDQQKLYFISDVQAPMMVEKLFLKSYRNEEARDSLLEDIKLHHPDNLFMLGDLTSRGSDENAWVPLERFINSIKVTKTKIYTIPGNHEYMTNALNGALLFKHHFQEKWMEGYCVSVDSIAVVLLNSNFEKMGDNAVIRQQVWYKSAMDSLDADLSVKAIIVCTHHPPYTNSTIVESSVQVQDLIVPLYENSRKSKLFISGHSHNLEYFADKINKHYLIIGGGGGLTQPLLTAGSQIYFDLINQTTKPLYFYLILERKGNWIILIARGFKKDFRFFETEIDRVMLD